MPVDLALRNGADAEADLAFAGEAPEVLVPAAVAIQNLGRLEGIGRLAAGCLSPIPGRLPRISVVQRPGEGIGQFPAASLARSAMRSAT